MDDEFKGSVEAKPEETVEKEGTEVKSILKSKLLWGCIGGGCVVVVILIVGAYLGAVYVPKIEDWLIDHNFLESDAHCQDSVSVTQRGSDGSREVIIEKNYVIEVVEKVKASVVSIAVSEVRLDPSKGTIEGSENIGTGFVIDDSGLILTNQHVVSYRDEDYVVITSDGKEHEVKEISRDDINDLAILKIEGNGLEVLPLGDSDVLNVGQFVIAIGTPLGEFPGSVTTGVISGLGRSVTASSGGFWGVSTTYEDVIQTDAAVNPGNSGGPLLDSDGNVIGINFATTSGADNISFAIPINTAKDRIDEYKKHGKFIRPYLGVEYQLISQADARVYRDVIPGALLVDIMDDSPADKAGLKKGDIITKIDGKVVSGSFSNIIQKYEVGDEIELKIWRNGEEKTVEVVLEEA